MFRSNFPKSAPLTLLFSAAFFLCLNCSANAAKITTNASHSNANVNNMQPISSKDEFAVPSKVVVIPSAQTLAESKAGSEGDAEEDNSTNTDNADVVEVEDVEEDADEDDDGESETSLTLAEKDDDTTSAFSVWGMVRGVWNWIKDDLSESLFSDVDTETTGATRALVRQVRDVSEAGQAAVESRTFGKIRRLQMALVPLIFKFGVLTAMVAFLIMLGMKTLFLVKLLVLMNAAAILAKFIAIKSNFGGYEHPAPPTWNYQSWTPPMAGGWAPSAPAPSYSHSHEQQPTKEIHLHIHNDQGHGYNGVGHDVGSGGHGHGWTSRNDPYAAYEPNRYNEVDNELNNHGPLAMLPTRYPSN